MRKLLFTCANILPFLFLTISNTFAQIQNDFDGDGKSDYTTIDIVNGSLQWKASLSTTGTEQSVAAIGSNGDHIILAPWFIPLSLNAGIVTLNTDKKIRWDVVDENNQIQYRTLGSDGDIVMPGDFNGNGVFDGAVARIKGKKVSWDVVTDLFTKPADAVPTQLTFGVSGDRVFYARPEGGSVDSLCTVGKGTGRRSRVICRDLFIATKRVDKKRFPSFAAGPLRPRPFPVHQPSGPDILGFELVSGSTVTYKFTNFEGTEIFSTQIQEKNPIAVVGEYNTDFAGEEVMVQGSDISYVINPVQKIVTASPKTSGVPVDQYNINTLKSVSSGNGGNSNNGNNNNGNNSGGEESPPPGNGLSSVCSSVAPLSGMLVKAEISDHISQADARATGYTLVCGTSCVQFVAKFYYCDGSEAGSLGYYGRWNGNGQPRGYGAAGGAPQHFVSSIRRVASSKKCGTNLYLQKTTGSPSQCLSFNAYASRTGSPF